MLRLSSFCWFPAVKIGNKFEWVKFQHAIPDSYFYNMHLVTVQINPCMHVFISPTAIVNTAMRSQIYSFIANLIKRSMHACIV